ncbi:MAG: formate dehydrogenase accessory protein FdhE [Acidobacteria bacterium]|nr:formate dehydrogenase accessory protein FdhE [Acidobacteriota bacterium]
MSGRARESGCAARTARARELTADASPAADLLGFYAALGEYQQRLAEQSASASVVSGFSQTSGSLLQAIDADWVGRAVREFAHWLVRLKPDATYLRDVPEDEWRTLFESYRANPDEATARCSDAALFALETVLQPIAERLAAIWPACGANASNSRCLICGGAPVVGVLREEGHGARRRLVCGLCLTEWDYLRLTCVKCGEQRFDALPVFTADQFPHARVDACDTCRSYLKTIDATKDGRAIPVVDDLATVTLDLWARDQGYTRVRTNLVRI